MSGDTDLILAGIGRLEGKIDGIDEKVSASRERLASLETSKVQHDERLEKLEACTAAMTAAVAGLPQQLQAGLPCDKMEARVQPLERQMQQGRGVLVAVGIGWSALVALPGLLAGLAIWLQGYGTQ